jgi:hypothetical protein
MASFKDLLTHALPEGRKGEVNPELRFNQIFQKGAKICDLFDGPICMHTLYFSFRICRMADGLRFSKTVTGRQKGQNQWATVKVSWPGVVHSFLFGFRPSGTQCYTSFVVLAEILIIFTPRARYTCRSKATCAEFMWCTKNNERNFLPAFNRYLLFICNFLQQKLLKTT